MATQLTHIRDHVIAVIGDNKAGHEHTRYSKPLIDTAINYAVAFIGTIDPPKFVSQVRHELVKGAIQMLPQDCVGLTNALTVLDADGNLVSVLSKGIAEDLQAFSRVAGCVALNDSASVYKPATFALSGDNQQLFFISPAVPEDGRYTILLSCRVNSQQALCDPAFRDKWESFYPAILEYVLYTLMAGEDDVRVNDTSQAHFSNFLRLLGISKAISDQTKKELEGDA